MTPTTTAQDINPSRMQITDHDLLIRLEGKVDTIGGKVDELKDELKPRLVAVEKVAADLTLWKHDFALGWKFTAIILSFIGTVIGFIVAQFTRFYFK